MLIDVRKSDLFTSKDIDGSVLEIMRLARREMIISNNVTTKEFRERKSKQNGKEEFCYSGMLLDFKLLPDYV